MADHSDADDRAVLREHGHEPPKRGRLTPEWKTMADDIRSGAEPGSPAGDYDQGITGADFPAGDSEVAATADAEETQRQATHITDTRVTNRAAEQRPRRVRNTPSLRDRLTSKTTGTKAKAKKKHPRIPVDRLVTMGWEGLGRLFATVSPPTGRLMQYQAPVAGLVLEDVIRDTVVDRVMQPIARAEEKGKKIAALAGPPLIVLAIERAQALPDDQRQMREAILVPMLRESLVLWHDVAGDKIEEQLARAERRAPAYEFADKLIADIFAPPQAGSATPDPEPAMAGV